MVDLGRANSRMKDFYDIWPLANSFRFEDDRLSRAIAATFSRRMTPLPATLPDALSAALAADAAKVRQWEALTEDLAVCPQALDNVVGELRSAETTSELPS